MVGCVWRFDRCFTFCAVCQGFDRAICVTERRFSSRGVLSLGIGQVGLDGGDVDPCAEAGGGTELASIAGGAGADNQSVLGGDGCAPKKTKHTDRKIDGC